MSHTTIKPQDCTKDLNNLVKESQPTDETIRNLLGGFQNCIYTDLFHNHDDVIKLTNLMNKIITLDRAIVSANDPDKYTLKKMQIPIIKKIIKLLEREYY